MRAMPVDRFGGQAPVRADGRVIYDIGLYRVKAPAQSQGSWDFYERLGAIPGGDAFLPMAAQCAEAR